MTKFMITLFGLVYGCVCVAQSIPPTVQVVERNLRIVLSEILVAASSSYPMSINVAPHPDDKWIDALALVVAREQGIDVVENGAGSVLHIIASDVSTKYRPTAASDTVSRVITVQLEASLVTGDIRKPLRVSPRVDSVLCRRDDALATQSDQHSSTHGHLPAAPSSFWDDAAQPLIFVAAAITTVALLFTVRSK